MTNIKMPNLKPTEGALKSYLAGFILSIILTLTAYFLVTNEVLIKSLTVAAILLLAFVQLIIQMIFFLHIGRETKPRWQLAMFVTFVGTILMVVIASIWIMQHLNYNMSLIQLDNVMQYGEGF